MCIHVTIISIWMGLKDHDQLFVYQKKKKWSIIYFKTCELIVIFVKLLACSCFQGKKCGYTIVYDIVKIYSKCAFGYRLFCWKLKTIKNNFWITVHTKVTIDKSECTVHVLWIVNSARGAGLKKESQKCRREKTQTQTWTNQTDTKRFIP